MQPGAWGGAKEYENENDKDKDVRKEKEKKQGEVPRHHERGSGGHCRESSTAGKGV